jgi:hypothetical protein
MRGGACLDWHAPIREHSLEEGAAGRGKNTATVVIMGSEARSTSSALGATGRSEDGLRDFRSSADVVHGDGAMCGWDSDAVPCQWGRGDDRSQPIAEVGGGTRRANVLPQDRPATPLHIDGVLNPEGKGQLPMIVVPDLATARHVSVQFSTRCRITTTKRGWVNGDA